MTGKDQSIRKAEVHCGRPRCTIIPVFQIKKLELGPVRSAIMGFLHCKQLALGLNSSVLDTEDMALGNQGCPEEEQSD